MAWPRGSVRNKQVVSTALTIAGFLSERMNYSIIVANEIHARLPTAVPSRDGEPTGLGGYPRLARVILGWRDAYLVLLIYFTHLPVTTSKAASLPLSPAAWQGAVINQPSSAQLSVIRQHGPLSQLTELGYW